MPVAGWRLRASLPAAGKIFKLPNICGDNRTKGLFILRLRFTFSFSSRLSSATERGRATGWDSAASRTTKNTWVRGRWSARTQWTPAVAPVSRNPGCHGHHPFRDLDGETRFPPLSYISFFFLMWFAFLKWVTLQIKTSCRFHPPRRELSTASLHLPEQANN